MSFPLVAQKFQFKAVFFISNIIYKCFNCGYKYFKTVCISYRYFMCLTQSGTVENHVSFKNESMVLFPVMSWNAYLNRTETISFRHTTHLIPNTHSPHTHDPTNGKKCELLDNRKTKDLKAKKTNTQTNKQKTKPNKTKHFKQPGPLGVHTKFAAFLLCLHAKKAYFKVCLLLQTNSVFVLKWTIFKRIVWLRKK